MNDYPLNIQSVRLSTYNRTQNATFEATNARSAKVYFKEIASNPPAFRTADFRFNQFEAMIFQEWFKKTLRNGFLPFDMKMMTEWGMATYRCRFMPDSLLSATREGPLWLYTSTIMIENYGKPAFIPDDIQNFPQYVELNETRQFLDLIVNTLMLEVRDAG